MFNNCKCSYFYWIDTFTPPLFFNKITLKSAEELKMSIYESFTSIEVMIWQ